MSGISREAIRLILWSERIADAARPQTSSTAPRELVLKVRELLSEATNLIHEAAKAEVRNTKEDE